MTKRVGIVSKVKHSHLAQQVTCVGNCMHPAQNIEHDGQSTAFLSNKRKRKTVYEMMGIGFQCPTTHYSKHSIGLTKVVVGQGSGETVGLKQSVISVDTLEIIHDT